ncbi:MAG: hypothetical protein JSS72_01135 [Armatimonadetes bacterium]|nr:hypothetical protein [Armatimonadota bacterium]
MMHVFAVSLAILQSPSSQSADADLAAARRFVENELRQYEREYVSTDHDKAVGFWVRNCIVGFTYTDYDGVDHRYPDIYQTFHDIGDVKNVSRKWQILQFAKKGKDGYVALLRSEWKNRIEKGNIERNGISYTQQLWVPTRRGFMLKTVDMVRGVVWSNKGQTFPWANAHPKAWWNGKPPVVPTPTVPEQYSAQTFGRG